MQLDFKINIWDDNVSIIPFTDKYADFLKGYSISAVKNYYVIINRDFFESEIHPKQTKYTGMISYEKP